MDDHLDEDERSQTQQQSGDSKLSDDEVANDEQPETNSAPTENNNTTQDFLKLLSGVKSNGDALLKMVSILSFLNLMCFQFKTQPAKGSKQRFAKKCPFCSVLFNARDKMTDHLATKHSDNILAPGIDVDALPNEDEAPGLSSTEELLGES